ncbi:MAG: M14 family metallopeptidase, partial [Rhodothermales bacterium]|nr:M14 family metallopeptidase [Rhodothermales bacterium]
MRRSLVFALTLLVAFASQAQPGPTGEFKYPHRILPDEVYDSSVPTPASILGFEVGDRAAFPDEILEVFRAMADASPRAVLFEHGRTHEGRPVVHMAVSSEANIVQLDDIKTGLSRLADPRGLSDSDASDLLDDLPVTAWLAYSVHGDETSGADAAMLVAYHLIASQSDEVKAWRDDMVVLIDPMQNPDGRYRWLTQVQQHRSVSPNVDDQSLLHSGYWPWGRTNHYQFDLNRDWILGVHPESQGRIRAARSWYPLLFVDAHEMGSQNTYMFSPDAEPLNLNFPDYLDAWQEKFGQDQAAAFDDRGWPYWNGFPFDNWYPGYGSSWGKIIGAVAILYEQASFDEDGIRRTEGSVITYYEAIHHQATSSWTNLRTLFDNRDELQRGFLADRRQVVSESGPYANRSWVVLPTDNRKRLEDFLRRLDLQGIEYGVASSSFEARGGRDMLGRSFARRAIPAGSIVITNRQPAARAAATLLSFDEQLADEIIKKERQSLLERGRGLMYDVTGWNLLMLHGLEALELDQHVSVGTGPYTPVPVPTIELAPSDVGYVVNNVDDAIVAFAARLMERGIRVRVATKDSEIDDRPLLRGSIIVLNTDNRVASEDGMTFSEPSATNIRDVVANTAAEVGVEVHPVATMQSPGELPDLGHSDYPLLQRPQIALIGRGAVNRYDYGTIWHAIDQELGIRHAHLDADNFTSRDLRRYNVIILPDRSGSWSDRDVEALKTWVEEGGTLIATGASAYGLAGPKSKLSGVRLLRDVLGSLDDYETTILREWHAAARTTPEASSVWSHTTPEDVLPWDSGFKRADSTELSRVDSWRRTFMPQGGVLVAARTNPKHWLTFGVGSHITVLYDQSRLL